MKNNYRVEGDVAYIEVVKRSGEVLEVIIDADQIERLSSCPKIYTNIKSRYAVMDFWEKGKKKSVYLHRYLLNAPPGRKMHVDHINHNVLDNRLCNLRYVTVSENGANRAAADVRSLTGVLGVSWHTVAGKYLARCIIHKKTHYLGLYDCIEEAEKNLIAFKEAMSAGDLERAEAIKDRARKYKQGGT